MIHSTEKVSEQVNRNWKSPSRNMVAQLSTIYMALKLLSSKNRLSWPHVGLLFNSSSRFGFVTFYDM